MNDIIRIDDDGISTPPTKKVAIQSDIQNKNNVMDNAMVDGDDNLDKLAKETLNREPYQPLISECSLCLVLLQSAQYNLGLSASLMKDLHGLNIKGLLSTK